MRTDTPLQLADRNLSVAWGKLFLQLMARNGNELPPVVLTVEQPIAGPPREDMRIREAVSRTLDAHGMTSIDDTAFTIFPRRPWIRRRARSREELYEYYRRVLPRLRARSALNNYGTYFARMIDYRGPATDGAASVNQIERLLGIWERDRANGSRTRRSALQIACYDPARDLTGQPVRGFPCLQQIGLSYDAAGGLALTAFYPTQYVFDRGYGNYLGLCHLGAFLAQEMGLRFLRLNCLVNVPERGSVTKRDLRALEAVVRGVVEETGPEQEGGALYGARTEEE
jgi:hypothetical protein